MSYENDEDQNEDQDEDQLDRLIPLARRAFELSGIDKYTNEELDQAALVLNDVLEELKINPTPFINHEKDSYHSQLFHAALFGFITRAKDDNRLIPNDNLLKQNLQTLHEELDPQKNQQLHGAENNLDYLGLKAKGIHVGIGYWLADTDINNALKNILDVDLKTNKAAKKYYHENVPVDVYIPQAIDIDSLNKSLKLIHEKAELPYVAYFNLNLGNRHWVSLKIKVAKNKIPKVTYVDGLYGTEQQKQATNTQISNLISDIIKDPEITVVFSDTQHDGWTCGYRDIGEVLKDLDISHPIVDAYEQNDINKLRESVFSAIEPKPKTELKNESYKKPSPTPKAKKDTNLPAESPESQETKEQNTAPTQLDIPASQAEKSKWAVQDTQQLVEAAYTDKDSRDNIIKTDHGCKVKYNENEIAINRTKNMHEVKTKGKDPKTLEEMIRIVGVMIDGINKKLKAQGKSIPKTVEIEKIPDEETKQILIDAGKKFKPPLGPLEIIDKRRKNEKNSHADETEDTPEDLLHRKLGM